MAASESAPDDSLYPIAVLIDELRNEDVQVGDIESRRDQNMAEKNEKLSELFKKFNVEPKGQQQQKRDSPRKPQPSRSSRNLRPAKRKKLIEDLSDPEEVESRKELASKKVSKVNQTYLSKIATSWNTKKYDRVLGTTCHQCRQKTTDSKTICRDPDCRGMRGFFCTLCLRLRYGEEVKDALLDKSWRCPPCRGICNCSICRRRSGLPCTGILAPSVQYLGYTNVKDYLEKGKTWPKTVKDQENRHPTLIRKNSSETKVSCPNEPVVKASVEEENQETLVDQHETDESYLKRLLKPFEGDVKLKIGCFVELIPLPASIPDCLKDY